MYLYLRSIYFVVSYTIFKLIEDTLRCCCQNLHLMNTNSQFSQYDKLQISWVCRYVRSLRSSSKPLRNCEESVAWCSNNSYHLPHLIKGLWNGMMHVRSQPATDGVLGKLYGVYFILSGLLAGLSGAYCGIDGRIPSRPIHLKEPFIFAKSWPV